MRQLDLNEIDRRLCAEQADVVARREGHLVELVLTSRRHPGRVVLAQFDDPGWEPRSLAYDVFVSADVPAALEGGWDAGVVLTRRLMLAGSRSRDAEKIAECLLRALDDDEALP